jgi:hypothetical protein
MRRISVAGPSDAVFKCMLPMVSTRAIKVRCIMYFHRFWTIRDIRNDVKWSMLKVRTFALLSCYVVPSCMSYGQAPLEQPPKVAVEIPQVCRLDAEQAQKIKNQTSHIEKIAKPDMRFPKVSNPALFVRMNVDALRILKHLPFRRLCVVNLHDAGRDRESSASIAARYRRAPASTRSHPSWGER